MKGFYEWVLDENKKEKVIRFDPMTIHIISPVLYDIWMAADRSEAFASFAIIATDPTVKKILEAGHDRSPININRDNLIRGLRQIQYKKALRYSSIPRLYTTLTLMQES